MFSLYPPDFSKNCPDPVSRGAWKIRPPNARPNYTYAPIANFWALCIKTYLHNHDDKSIEMIQEDYHIFVDIHPYQFGTHLYLHTRLDSFSTQDSHFCTNKDTIL